MTAHHEWTVTESGLEDWGRAIGEAASAGDVALPLVVTLRGPLGAGKSVLARAVARGAGVSGPIPSPTYNLLFSYEGRDGVMVHHLDLYRLEHPEEVWELGWRELTEGRQVTMVEWPERAEGSMPADRWDVELAPVPDDPLLRRLRVRREGDAPTMPRWRVGSGGETGR